VSDDIVNSRLTAPVGGGNSRVVPEIAALFLRLGCTAFGGPAAHVTVIEAEVVTRRGWLTRADFLDLLGVVQVLPGPNSTELAIHIGHVRDGWRGGIVAGLCFVLPSVVMVWLLASVAAAPSLRPVMTAVMWWLAPVVVAVLLEAQWKFGSQAWHRPFATVVMPLTMLASFVVQSDAFVLLIGAALSMLLSRGKVRGAGIATAAVLAIGASAAVLAQSTTASIVRPDAGGIFFYFLRTGATVFGSGYVLLAYLQRDLVNARHWLTLADVTQASALAQVTPGPLFATATAVGYMIGGHAGALVATIGIFTPAFLSITISAPIRALIQRSPIVRAGLDGVVVASVAVLGRAVVGFAMPLGGWQILSCLLAAVLLFVGRVQATILLLGAVSAGIVATLFHFSPS
jgi:chromate transporter